MNISEEHLSSILYSMDEVVWSARLPDLCITYVSPSAEQIFGRKPSDFTDKPDLWRTVIYPDDMQLVEEALQKVRKKGRAEFECRAYKSGETLIWINVRIKIIYDREGEPLRLDGVLSDITDRKMTEKILQESEERYRNLISNVPGVIFRCSNDPHWTMEYISEAIKGITGYRASDLLNNKVRSYVDLLHPEDTEEVTQNINEHISRKKPYSIRYRVAASDGSFKWVNERGQGIYNEKGDLIYLDGIIIDITERRKTETALLEAEQKYRHTLDNMLEGAQIIGFDWRYIYVNDTAASHGQKKKEEMLGRTVMECFPGIERTKMFKTLNRCMLDRGHYQIEFEYTFSDGNKYFYELSIQPVPEGIFILSLDITERKQAEEELLETTEELEDFFNLTLDLLCIADIEGNFIKINRSWEEILGYTVKELENKNFLDFVHPDDLGATLESLEKLGKQERVLNFVNRYKSKNGYYHYIEWRSFPRGKTIYAAARDITERVLYEEQLKHQSFHDRLTGAYNRAYFEEEISRLEGGRHYPITVFSVDVDGLKLVNDAMGHSSGDELLKNCAGIIKQTLRGTDVFARVGGDEFAIILPDTDSKVADKVHRRITANVTRHNKNHPDMPVSISIGKMTAENPENTLEEVYKKADNRMYRSKLQKGSSARKRIIESLKKSLEEKDFLADGHADRIARLTEIMGKQKNLTTRKLKNLNLLSHYHDIGKAGVDDEILFKEEPLTDEEWIQLRQHSEIGYRIASSAQDLSKAADLILKHHERWDGKGYPLKLKGEKIPLECRIFAIAEAYDVMTNHRPYRKVVSPEEATEEIKRNSGTQFDPELVDLFLQVTIQG